MVSDTLVKRGFEPSCGKVSDTCSNDGCAPNCERVSDTSMGASGVSAGVHTEIDIDRPRADVAAYAADPDNATARYENINSVEWKTARPLAVGSQVAGLPTSMRSRSSFPASGFSKFAAPIMGKAMRRANRRDLQRIKEILESQPRA